MAVSNFPKAASEGYEQVTHTETELNIKKAQMLDCQTLFECALGGSDCVERLKHIDWEIIAQNATNIWFVILNSLLLLGIMFGVSSFLANKDNTEIDKKYMAQHGFEVQSFMISELSISSYQMMIGRSELILNVSNKSPNDLYHEPGLVSLYFNKRFLWPSQTEAFYQRSGSSTMLNVSVEKKMVQADSYLAGMLVKKPRKFRWAIPKNQPSNSMVLQ